MTSEEWGSDSWRVEVSVLHPSTAPACDRSTLAVVGIERSQVSLDVSRNTSKVSRWLTVGVDDLDSSAVEAERGS